MTRVHWLDRGWPAADEAWLDHRRHHGTLDRAAHDVALAQLKRLVDGTLEPSAAALADLLGRLRIPWPPRRQDEVPRPEPRPFDTKDVARIALDFAPAAGDDGPAVVLGPFVPVLDVRRPLHIRAWTGAVAWSAFLLHDDLRPPARAWARDGRMRPPESERARLHAVHRSPPNAWRIVRAEARGWLLRPLIPMGEAWIPSGPVDLSEVGGVDGPPTVGGVLLGRVVIGPEVPRAVAGVVLPVCPPADLVAGWFVRLALPHLAADRDLPVEELLRLTAHHLAGELHAWWWAQRAGRPVEPPVEATSP